MSEWTWLLWPLVFLAAAVGIYLAARLISAAYFVSKRQFYNGEKHNGQEPQ